MNRPIKQPSAPMAHVNENEMSAERSPVGKSARSHKTSRKYHPRIVDRLSSLGIQGCSYERENLPAIAQVELVK